MVCCTCLRFMVVDIGRWCRACLRFNVKQRQCDTCLRMSVILRFDSDSHQLRAHAGRTSEQERLGPQKYAKSHIYYFIYIYYIYYWRKGTLKCDTINLIGREQEARALIGREAFRGANKNTERIHDSQWEGCILLSTNQKA